MAQWRQEFDGFDGAVVFLGDLGSERSGRDVDLGQSQQTAPDACRRALFKQNAVAVQQQEH